ncbi:hypothetical protein HYU16_01640 [Candidatus Woesearchaeota archaeon]|nr:hypothetical protein [Candidatus Woesearchaeota archaeon]
MISMLQGKKGQFYILIALLLIAYAYTLIRQEVPVRKPKDTFQLLHEGYMSEGMAAINSAVYEEANVTARFAGFTGDYMAFAKSAAPNFRLVYLLRHKDQLVVGNRLDSSLNITLGNADYSIGPGSEQTAAVSNATIRIAGNSYSFVFLQEGEIQLKALFREASRLTTRVFVSG